SLYFETGIQDELRTNGFSKDGKTSESQIILGLLVSADGYPLSYSIFNTSVRDKKVVQKVGNLRLFLYLCK
ncbi:MAG: hypothetical protein IKN02_04285, partial [Prevotella sp.]|nr:hypothetical protein [Prevotella sp.]